MALPCNDHAGTGVPPQLRSGRARCLDASIKQGRFYMNKQNQNPGQQGQNPSQKPGQQQQGGSPKPGQQQGGQKPGQHEMDRGQQNKDPDLDR
jgi:hypothetical protein